MKTSPGTTDGRKDQSRSSRAGARVEPRGGRAVAGPLIQGLVQSLSEEQKLWAV